MTLEDIIEPIGTFLGYFFRAVLLFVIGIVYLPAYLIVTALTKPFEDSLKEFGVW